MFSQVQVILEKLQEGIHLYLGTICTSTCMCTIFPLSLFLRNFHEVQTCILHVNDMVEFWEWGRAREEGLNVHLHVHTGTPNTCFTHITQGTRCVKESPISSRNTYTWSVGGMGEGLEIASVEVSGNIVTHRNDIPSHRLGKEYNVRM